MWYHHYVFLLPVLFIRMAWTRFSSLIVAFEIAFLLLVQIDRYRLTTGRLVHIFGHLTIWGRLFYQAREFICSVIIRR